MSLVWAMTALLVVSPVASAEKRVDSFFPVTTGTGTLGGQFSTPRDLAANQTTPADARDGWLYVVDSGNHRVQAFDAAGDFRFAVGADVVATGPGNAGASEVQTLTVKATSGTFTLTFSGQTTSPLAFNASAGAVQSALNALSTVGGVGGSVAVSGGPGDATGTSPYTITFGGALGGVNAGQITVNGNGLGIAVGTPLSCAGGAAATTNYQWLRNGAPIAAATSSNYVTAPADAGTAIQCQVFSLNANAGATQVSNPANVVSAFPATAPPAPPASIAQPAQTAALTVGGPGGQTLTCNPGAWTGGPSFTYQWYRNGVAIGGATANTYAVSAGDVATAAVFQCAVTGANAGGSATRVSANRATAPAPSPAAPTASATVPALTTTATTTEGVSAFETCVAANGDVCKAGVAGSAGGMFSNPQGLDLDQSTGSFYVRDTGNRRVQQFTATGGFVKAWGGDVAVTAGTGFEVCATAADCQAGTTTAALADDAGSFGATSTTGTGLAVVPPGAPNAGNVIAADPQNRRLMEFDPDAAAPADVFVRAWGWNVNPSADPGPTLFEICTAGTTCQAGVAPGFGEFNNGQFANDRLLHVAVNANGIVYALNAIPDGFSQRPRVERFDSSAASAADLVMAPMAPLGPAASVTALEVDAAADRLYQADNSGGQSIKEYDTSSATPTLVDTHLAGTDLVANGIGYLSAADPADEKLYITSNSGSPAAHRVYVLDDDGAESPPEVTLNPVTGVTAHGASFSGAANPGGFPSTYRFEYSKNGTSWTAVAPNADLGSGASPVAIPLAPAQGTATGLEANTLYRVRVALTRGFGNGTVYSSEILFATNAPPPDVTTLPVNGRGATTATLEADVNPNGNPTTYRFEYGRTNLYGARAPVPDGDAGSGGMTKRIAQVVSGLDPDTTYHYRVVAENEEGVAVGYDVTFTTRAASAPGPSGRAYELVSPADKIGGVGVGRYYPGDKAAAPAGYPSADGDRYAATSTNGAMLLDAEFAYANDWAFAERLDDTRGWVSHSPFTRPNFGPAGTRFADINAASDDLSLLLWRSNSSHISLFSEVESFPVGYQVPTLGDWRGRYEVFLPTDPAQGFAGDAPANQTVSAGGSHAVVDAGAVDGPFVGGLTGSGDPYLDRVSGRAVYVNDVSAGLSDTFPGDGVRAPVAVCDAGTEIPARVESSPGVFEQASQSCPAPQAGRDAALISTRGATTVVGNGTAKANVISADGSKVFFMSPDPDGADPDGAGPLTRGQDPCGTGTGANTSCPAQLYVRQAGSDGSAVARWISRSEVGGQDASLMATALFEGATPDGDKAFFRTNSPLTADDPNGACGAPCTTGAPSPTSWDLYMYDFTDDPGDDPAAGDLARISRGPSGTADGNVQPFGTGGALRFAADDGRRLYFTSAAPLAGVPGAGNGTSTAPAGTPSTTATTNLYVYDAARPSAEQFQFVALLPRSTSGIAGCASTAVDPGEALGVQQTTGPFTVGRRNCVRGTADGSFVTFFTDGNLVAGDPDGTSGDIYAYDADEQELSRISAPQGGAGGSYTCVELPATASCHGDPGFDAEGPSPRPRLGMVSDPATAGDRVAFFQSKARLVPDDTDSEYDVYQWRNGELTLLSVGTSTGAYYAGNSTDGEDVFFLTRDALTWQDTDTVMDVYDARVGGGIPEPSSPPNCDVLADGCQQDGAGRSPLFRETAEGADGNAAPGDRVSLRLSRPSVAELRRAARSGVLALRVRTLRAGIVRVSIRAKIGKRARTVARGSKRASKPGPATVRVRLSRTARRWLRRNGAVRLAVRVTQPGAGQSRSMSLVLRRAGK